MANAKLTLASWPQEANNFSIVAFVTCAYAKNAQVVDKWLLQKVQQPREVEMRLIDADNLVDELEELADSYVDNNCSDFTRGTYNACRQQGVDAAIEVVKEQTPIDTVKHGRWIFVEDIVSYIKCSECGDDICWVNTKRPKYCPNCGARMDGNTND